MNVGQGNLSVYGGVGTSFTKGSTGFVADFKGSMPYGNSVFSGGFRVRNNINGSSMSTQIRVQPITVTIPVADKTKLYATPYVATKIDYNTGNTTTNVGCFAGASQKLGNVSIFVEGQIYDVTKINAGTTSINAGIAIPL